MKKIVFLILLFGVTSSLSAVTIRGNFTSDLYLWEDSTQNHIRPYESLRGSALLWQGAKKQSISFKSNLRWTTDLSDKFASDPQLFVYETNLKFSNLPNNYNFTLGRQFVYNSAGSRLIDGLRVNYLYNNYQGEVFVGADVDRFDPETIQSFSKDLVLGFNARRMFNKKILFMEKLMLGTSALGIWDNDIYVFKKVAFDARFNLATTRVYLKTSYDMLNNKPSELLGRISQNSNNWYYSLEFRHRQPSLSNNSVFSIIDYKNYNQFRLELNRRLSSTYTLISGLNYTIYNNDNNLDLQLGLSQKLFTVSFYHQVGYGGERNGLSGFARYSLPSNFELFGSANLNRYKVQDESEDIIDAYSTQIGLIKKLSGDWQLRAEWQLLNNAVNDYDSRFHFRINKGFSF